MNHEKIAEGVGDGIKKLSEDLVFWNRQLGVHGDSPAMQGYIRDLYVVIFEFLTEVFVDWSSSGWKRLASSFNKNAFDRLFGSKRAQMDAVAARLDREANLETQKRIRAMYDDHLKLTQSSKDSIAELKSLALDLGSRSQRLLEGLDFKPIAYAGLPSAPQPETQILAIEASSDADSDAHSLPSSDMYCREDLIKTISSHINVQNVQHNQLGSILSDTSNLVVDARVADGLQSWTKSSKADKLWIQGPHDTTRPSQSTLTAVSLVALAKRHNIPIISYFCSIAESNSPGASMLSDSLSEMVSSLIVQMVPHLPSQFRSELDLSPSRLGLVTQGSGSISEKLDLLSDLRSLLPKFVICIIDCLQILEDRSDRPHTLLLRQVIHRICTLDSSHEGVETLTKICFTTDGYVDILGAAARAEVLEKISFEHDATHTDADDMKMVGDAMYS